MKAAIVCGYGSIVDHNLLAYMDSIADKVVELEINLLVLSGGCTFTSSKISEARLMASLLNQRKVQVDVLLEEQALTTLHNLIYAKQVLSEICKKPETIYIFCDQVRFFKICLLTQIVMKDDSVSLIKIGRQENIIVLLLQIPSTVAQVLGALSPPIAKRLEINKQNWIQKKR
jgi:hypothetical protein